MPDVAIVGGGVVGLSLAFELAGRGIRVELLEQGELGREASWAGAGILPPGCLAGAHTPEARLRAGSHALWPAWTATLRELTGIDNGYRTCGGLLLAQAPAGVAALAAESHALAAEGVEFQSLEAASLHACEPALGPGLTAALRLPELGQVRNPRHLKALIAGCSARGVILRPGTAVVGWERHGPRITAAQTPAGPCRAERFVVAAGAWARSLLAAAGCLVRLVPVRGQIVLLQHLPLPFRHVLLLGARYLVPRPDGRILVGATEELAGFEKRSTAAGVKGLLEFAGDLVPGLAQAQVERSWAGLRPCSCDGLPYLGRVPGLDNLCVAAGHFRAGLQTSPMTAVLVSDLVLGTPPTLDPTPYRPERGLPGAEDNRIDLDQVQH